MMPYSSSILPRLTCSTRQPPKPALFRAPPHVSLYMIAYSSANRQSTGRVKGEGMHMYIEIEWHVSTSTEMDPCTSTYVL